jgi:hypothetical protein
LGLGWFGLSYILGTLAFFLIVGIKCAPVYLNQMKIKRDVHRVATDPENAGLDAGGVRRALSRFWDIDSIDYLGFADVKLAKTQRGKALTYDYEVLVPLFYNIDLHWEFTAEEPMAGGGGAAG